MQVKELEDSEVYAVRVNPFLTEQNITIESCQSIQCSLEEQFKQLYH